MGTAAGVPRLAGGASVNAPVSPARKAAARGARTEALAPLPPRLVSQQVGEPVVEGAWARVTPGDPVGSNKAALVMLRPSLVEGDPGYADFADRCYRDWIWKVRVVKQHGKPDQEHRERSKKKALVCPKPGAAALWINAPGPGVFAAECDVAPLKPSAVADVWKLRSKGTTTTVSELPIANRLLFTIAAAEAGWTNVVFRGTHDKWRLFGCSVHRL